MLRVDGTRLSEKVPCDPRSNRCDENMHLCFAPLSACTFILLLSTCSGSICGCDSRFCSAKVRSRILTLTSLFFVLTNRMRFSERVTARDFLSCVSSSFGLEGKTTRVSVELRQVGLLVLVAGVRLGRVASMLAILSLPSPAARTETVRPVGFGLEMRLRTRAALGCCPGPRWQVTVFMSWSRWEGNIRTRLGLTRDRSGRRGRGFALGFSIVVYLFSVI